MRCVASAKSTLRRSISCCQRSATSEELQRECCERCSWSSSDMCFVSFLMLSVFCHWRLWRDRPFSSQKRRGQALSQHEQQVVGHHFGTRLVLFNPPVHRSHQHAHQQMSQQHRIIGCKQTCLRSRTQRRDEVFGQAFLPLQHVGMSKEMAFSGGKQQQQIPLFIGRS